MRLIFSYFRIILLMLFFCSCSNKKNEKIQIIDIESAIDNFQIFRLSDLSNNLEYIQLESNDSCFIKDIKYLDINDNFILIYDWEKCLLYSSSGKFIEQISKKGKGPGEYNHPGHVKLLKDEIWIPERKTISIYDTDGNYIESIKSPGEFSNELRRSNYLPVTDSLIFVQIPNNTGIEKYRLSLINREGEVVRNYKNTDIFRLSKPRYSTFNEDAQFYRINKNIRYKEVLYDTVWQIEDNQMLPVYIFNLGKYGAANGIKGLPIDNFFDRLSEMIHLTMLFESNNFIFLKISFRKFYPFDFYKESNSPSGKSPYEIIGIYNKNKDDFFLVKPTYKEGQTEPTGIENDLDGGINFMPQYLIEETLFIGWCNAFELKLYVASKVFKNSIPKFPEKKKELEKLANILDENDNPVLMLVKLKE